MRRAARRRACAGLAALLAVGVASSARAALDATQSARVERLLDRVAAQTDVRFIRNGEVHSAEAAAEHLRLKLRNAGRRISTAEQFVEHLASRSSITGRPYRLRFPDGSEVDAGPWLMKALAEIRP
jgi:hypothetical protein